VADQDAGAPDDAAKAAAAWAKVAPNVAATLAWVRSTLERAGQGVASLSQFEAGTREQFGKASRDLMPHIRSESDATVTACRVLAAELERLALLLEGKQLS